MSDKPVGVPEAPQRSTAVRVVTRRLLAPFVTSGSQIATVWALNVAAQIITGHVLAKGRIQAAADGSLWEYFLPLAVARVFSGDEKDPAPWELACVAWRVLQCGFAALLMLNVSLTPIATVERAVSDFILVFSGVFLWMQVLLVRAANAPVRQGFARAFAIASSVWIMTTDLGSAVVASLRTWLVREPEVELVSEVEPWSFSDWFNDLIMRDVDWTIGGPVAKVDMEEEPYEFLSTMQWGKFELDAAA